MFRIKCEISLFTEIATEEPTKEQTEKPTPWTTDYPSTSRLRCGYNEFKCRDRCIPAEWKCDGFADCRGGVDEINCF